MDEFVITFLLLDERSLCHLSDLRRWACCKNIVAMADRSWESVEVQGPDSDGVATLTLNRPARFNTLYDALFKELRESIRALDFNPDVRVIILNAAGPHFCAGIDLRFFAELATDGPPGNYVYCGCRCLLLAACAAWYPSWGLGILVALVISSSC